MNQKKNLTVDVRVVPARYDFEFSTLSIRRYGKRQRVKPLKDTKELFKHLYESDNDMAFIGSATAAGIAIATFFAFFFGMALPEASAGNWVPTYVMSAIAALSTLSWWLVLRSTWVRRIVQPNHVQLEITVSDSSTTWARNCNIKSDSSHEETIATLKRVVTKHSDMLVDISDTLEELDNVGASYVTVHEKINESIQHLVNIEHNITSPIISRKEANMVVASAKERINNTASMLKNLEEELKELK